MKSFFSRGFCLYVCLIVFGVLAASSALAYDVPADYDFERQRNLNFFNPYSAQFWKSRLGSNFSGSECSSPDTCPGLCFCEVTVKKSRLETKFYGVRFYEEVPPVSILQEATYEGSLLKTNVTVTGTLDFHFLGDKRDSNGRVIEKGSCGLEVKTNSNVVRSDFKDVVPKAQCKYYSPFCCCVMDENNPTKCTRSVYYDGNFNRECADGLKPLDMPKDGCQAVKRPANASLTPSEADAELAKALQGLREDARTNLNRLDYYYRGSGSATDAVNKFIGQATRFLFAVMGMWVLVFFSYAGFLWLTSAGNSEKLEKAKQIFVWTSVGVLLTLASYLIISAVFTILK